MHLVRQRLTCCDCNTALCASQLLCSCILQVARAHWQTFRTLVSRLQTQPSLSPVQAARRSPTTTCCRAHMTLLAINCCWLRGTSEVAWHCFQCVNSVTAKRQGLGLRLHGSAASTLRWVLVLHAMPCPMFWYASSLMCMLQHPCSTLSLSQDWVGHCVWWSQGHICLVTTACLVTHAGRSRPGMDGQSSRCGCNGC